MAITTTREQRRIENHERALAAYMEHHAAAVAVLERITEAITNHDTAPDPETITWGTVGSMERARHALQRSATGCSTRVSTRRRRRITRKVTTR